MRYVKARYDQEDEREAYRIYVTECLRGDRDIPHFYDYIREDKVKEESADEIIDRIKKGVNSMK